MHSLSLFILGNIIHNIVGFHPTNNPCFFSNGIIMPMKHKSPSKTISNYGFFMKKNKMNMDETQTQDSMNEMPTIQRRAMLQKLLSSSSFAMIPVTLIPNDVQAKTDPLFAPNPLTNPVLEQVRSNINVCI